MSIHAGQLRFKERFGCSGFPVYSMIYRWANKFRTRWTVHSVNGNDTNRQSHPGRSTDWLNDRFHLTDQPQVWHRVVAAFTFTGLDPPPQTFICEDTLRTGTWQLPPDHPCPEGSTHSSHKSGPQGGMRAGGSSRTWPDGSKCARSAGELN